MSRARNDVSHRAVALGVRRGGGSPHHPRGLPAHCARLRMRSTWRQSPALPRQSFVPICPLSVTLLRINEPSTTIDSSAVTPRRISTSPSSSHRVPPVASSYSPGVCSTNTKAAHRSFEWRAWKPRARWRLRRPRRSQYAPARTCPASKQHRGPARQSGVRGFAARGRRALRSHPACRRRHGRGRRATSRRPRFPRVPFPARRLRLLPRLGRFRPAQRGCLLTRPVDRCGRHLQNRPRNRRNECEALATARRRQSERCQTTLGSLQLRLRLRLVRLRENGSSSPMSRRRRGAGSRGRPPRWLAQCASLPRSSLHGRGLLRRSRLVTRTAPLATFCPLTTGIVRTRPPIGGPTLASTRPIAATVSTRGTDRGCVVVSLRGRERLRSELDVDALLLYVVLRRLLSLGLACGDNEQESQPDAKGRVDAITTAPSAAINEHRSRGRFRAHAPARPMPNKAAVVLPRARKENQ